MIISEFLPNPIGKDTEGEWFELFNDGSQQVNLSGWFVKDASGKKFTFSGVTINSGSYLRVDYSTSRISLNNNGETIYLYDSSGNLVDEVGYQGSAPEGQSLVRQEKEFIFTQSPTPGQANPIIEDVLENSETGQLNSAPLDANVLNSSSPLNWPVISAGLLACFLLSAFFIFVFGKFNLFSEGD